ncbi:MAG TPA: alpha-galactosidase [Acidobacteriaceae bacterium]|nr:alpha-galactosidase [Acidobacteriaceae bacterium]
MKRIAAALLSVAVSTACAQKNASAPNRWTLTNGIVSRTIAFDADHGLITQSWKNLIDGKEFIDPQQQTMDSYCREFRFSMNGRAYTATPSQFTVAHAEETTDSAGAHHLDLSLASRDHRVDVAVHYILPDGSTGIRQFLSIRNDAAQSAVLSQLSIACEPIAPAQPVDLLAFGGYGEDPREIFFTGRSDDVAILLENAATGDGVGVLSEVPGVLRRTEVGVIGKWHQWEPGVNAMYDTDLFPFERTLSPGETFTTAAVSFVLYQRGTAQDPHWLIPQYVLANIARPLPTPFWTYNDWEPFEAKIGGPELAEVEHAVANSGFGLFVIDDGWEQKRGDNAVDTDRFPQGLAPLGNIARQTGMRFGLWSPMAVASPDAPVVSRHPEWECHDRNGNVRYMAGMVQMNLASPYRQDALERLSNLVRGYQLSYIKLDLTTAFNTYGEQPGCYGPGGEHAATQADHEVIPRDYEALTYIADGLHRRFPHLLIDYSFELWGGKHLIDYGLLRVANLDWISNIADRTATDAGPRAARMLLDQRAMAIPAESMLIGNLQGESGSWRVRSATEMGSWPLLLGDFRKVSPQDRAQYANWIERYGVLRKQVALNQSFFPLGTWRQPRSNRWDGFARFSREGEGLIVLFRNDAHDTAARVSIPGFPDGGIIARIWDSSQTFSWTGEQLRHGIEIPLSGQNAEVIEVRRSAATENILQ